MNCYAPPIVLDWFLRNQALSELCYHQLSQPVQTTPWDAAQYLKTFAFTCALEAVFYFWAMRGKRELGARIGPLLLANLATHPFIYFGAPGILAQFHTPAIAFIVFAETFAPLTEALLLTQVWKIPPKRALLAMITGNLFSWWVGASL